MSDIITLDERIRDRARNLLRKEIEEATRSILSLIYECPDTVYPVPEKSAQQLLNEMGTAIEKSLDKKRGDKAVREFLERVDSFTSDLDELRENLET